MQRRRILMIVVAVELFLAAIILGVYFFGGWRIDLVLEGSDPLVLEYGVDYPESGARAFLTSKLFLRSGYELPVEIDSEEMDNPDLGIYEVTYKAHLLGYSGSAVREVEIVDTTPPDITLNYVEDSYTRPIDTYDEEGFVATDLHDGDITDQVIRKDPGDGYIYYEVADQSGNTATAKREIIYDDREAPVITLTGETVLTLEKGMPFEDPGFTAVDDCDGDVTGNVTVETTDTQIIYTVTDSYHNTTTASRDITYIDTMAPEITLSGDYEIWMKAGQDYTDPGYTATDLADGDMTALVSISGEVNRYHAGDYTITYSATDQAGNTGSVNRIVHVEPRPQSSAVAPGDKVVYLTFDDGPGPYTQQLLDVLAAYNVKATFFVTNGSPSYQYLIGSAAAAGHSIGIHSYSHKYETIYASEDAFFEDLAAMQSIIVAQTGWETTLMRFPGGSSNTVSSFNPGVMTSLTQAVTDMGYQYFDWNVSSGDAGSTTDTDTVAYNVISGMQGHNVSVVLQHDIKAFSVDAVEMILAWGIENGYTFLPLKSSSPTAHHGINN